MSDARREILERVRAAAERRDAAPAASAPSADPGAPAPAALSPELLTSFARAAAAVGCSVHGPAPPHEVASVVVALLRELHAHELIAWGGDELPVPGMRDALLERGFQLLVPALGTEREGRLARLAKLDEADVGLTGALAGLADTGTLVLGSGERRSRLAWLLPPVHVALLPADRLYPSLPAFLSGAGAGVRASAGLCLVTGPSRSGDIEMILTRGVHGPGAVHVVLVA